MDIFLVAVAYYMALWLRFDCSFEAIPENYLHAFERTTLWNGFFCCVLYALAGLYNRIWHFAGYRELQRCILVGLVCILAHYWLMRTLCPVVMPLSYFVFGGCLHLGALVFSRFIWRFIYLLYSRATSQKSGIRENAMLVGAGSAGQLILRDLSTTRRRNIHIRCIIDDDPSKWGCSIEDVPVVGGQESIENAVQRYKVTKIFVALPTASMAQRKAVLEQCQKTGCSVRILPGIFQFTDGEVSLAKMRDVSPEDVLGQENLSVKPEEIRGAIFGKTILITGGGGSIGAELALQVAECSPKKLIILEIDENAAEVVRHRVESRVPSVQCIVLMGSVRDTWRLEYLFREYRPDVVFHAAAYKRVNLIENSPGEALKNNVLGTYKTAYFAMAYGCERFVLASSDKAVNPTSFYGACTRLCEILMQTMEHLSRNRQLDKLFAPTRHHTLLATPGTECRTEFASVRFGNVLDANGSFFRRFRRQVSEGGPVTFADKRMTRFCMGLRDTVQLLLQASCYAKDGEVFVLDMGTPVRLDEIARKLIRLSGLVPDEDISIQYTGLKPGEKLEEEPLMWEEGMRKTKCPRIYIANPTQINFTEFLAGLQRLFQQLDQHGTCSDFQAAMAGIVNSYHGATAKQETQPSGSHTSDASERSSNTVRNLESIVEHFAIPGEVLSALPITKGYINHTYYVDACQGDGSIRRFILQQINTKVFPDAVALMENMVRVTAHLQKFRLPGRPDAPAVAQVILTKNGANFLETSSGAWRMVSCFLDVHSYDIPESPQVYRYAGEAFGGFLKAVSTLPADSLHEVIPNFHNTWSRYQDLLKAIEKDPVGRVKDVQPEIAFVKRHEALFRMLPDALAAKEIPLRIGHNDCNLNNILFDNATNLPVAVIDLDTTMPSSPLYDFGDAIRIGTNTAKDDEKDLSKVSCNLELFKEYATGWLSACGDMLTARERELLPYASLVITSEDGIRFLMDHINGDTYYYTYYPGQNLDRSRTQLALLRDMEEKLPQIKNILNELR